MLNFPIVLVLRLMIAWPKLFIDGLVPVAFSNKTYVVGTQKNRLNETVLSSTQNICKN